jgi:hypothetical protein
LRCITERVRDTGEREFVCVCVREREKERDREEEREVVRHTHIQRARKSKGGVNSSKGNRAS